MTFAGSDDCSNFAGKATVSANMMDVHITISTAVLCGDSIAVANVLDGNVAWTIDGNQLTITRPDTGVLTYTVMG